MNPTLWIYIIWYSEPSYLDLEYEWKFIIQGV